MNSITIRVDVNNRFGHYAASIELRDEVQVECFNPCRTTDEPMLAIATGDIYAKDDEFQRVIKTREDAAKIIAEQLTEHIINAMKKNDTHNGYKV